MWILRKFLRIWICVWEIGGFTEPGLFSHLSLSEGRVYVRHENWRRTATRTWWKELWEHLNLPVTSWHQSWSRRQQQEGVSTVFILPKPVSVPSLIKWSIKREGVNKYINGRSSAPKRPLAAIWFQLVMSPSCVMQSSYGQLWGRSTHL